MQDYQRPPTLHSYGMRSDLEQALTAGKFTLLPSGGFLSLSFSREWNKNLFEILSPADCCLVIHNTEEFGERLHRAVQRPALGGGQRPGRADLRWARGRAGAAV